MNLGPVTLEHGERYGQLTVLSVLLDCRRGVRYRCGCTCGNSKFYAKASRLLDGSVTRCARCKRADR